MVPAATATRGAPDAARPACRPVPLLPPAPPGRARALTFGGTEVHSGHVFNMLLENTVYKQANREVQLHKSSRETGQHGMQCISLSFTYCLLSCLVPFVVYEQR